MKRLLFHLFAALVPFYAIGEAYGYKRWGSFAFCLQLAYSLWTYESGYRHGKRTAWDYKPKG